MAIAQMRRFQPRLLSNRASASDQRSIGRVNPAAVPKGNFHYPAFALIPRYCGDTVPALQLLCCDLCKVAKSPEHLWPPFPSPRKAGRPSLSPGPYAALERPSRADFSLRDRRPPLTTGRPPPGCHICALESRGVFQALLVWRAGNAGHGGRWPG